MLFLALSAVGVTPTALAADATIYTATYVDVAPPSETQGAALLRAYREASRRDAGNVRVEILQRIERPSQFVILAAWKDQPALDAHTATPPARELVEKLGPLLASPNDGRRHSGLAASPAAAAGAPHAVYAVTHVDVIPPRKDDGAALLARLADDSRQDPGNVRFEVWQQISRPNHFTVVEAWQDRSAFDAHGMAPHTRQFRVQLAPMSGALYDERLYVVLR